MRRARSAALLSILVPLTGVAPVVSLPHASPRPVTSEVRSVALSGVDRAVSRGVLRRSLSAATRVLASAPASTGRAADRSAGRPEVLASRRGLAEFSLLGVTWRGGAAGPAPAVLVRTHGADGWSGWTALDVAPTPTDGESPRARPGTEPVWVGPSDGYQVRVDTARGGVPRGLRVDLIDPGSSPADAAPGAGTPARTAQAAAGMPQIFTRAQWGADERIRRGSPSYTGPIKAGFVHHTAGTNNYSEAEVPKILRAVYAYHVKGNGWSDVGYNFLVDRFGRLWEGRYGGMDRAVLGAHTGGFNVDTFAVSAIGNYDKAAAPPAMVDAIARVMAWKLAANFRDPNGSTVLTSQGGGTSRYSTGTRVTFANISGHRDAGRTSCPGGNLYAQLGQIRALAGSYLGTTMFDPRLSASSAVYGTGASVTATAAVSSEQQWRLEVREACRGTLVRTMTGPASPAARITAVWDLRDDGGGAVRPGSYSISLVSADAAGSSYTWTAPFAVNAVRTTPPAVGSVAPPGRTGFVPLDPAKLYDTTDPGLFPLGPGQQVNVRVPGVGRVPDTGVGAVALNISATCATSPTTVTAWPAGSARPPSPALNVPTGSGASALAVTALGGDGAVSILNASGTTELTVHVVGYYPFGGGHVFRPTKPLRLYDSERDGSGRLAPGAQRTVTMRARGGVPAASMSGALLNVTAKGASGVGSLTAQSPESSRDSATVRFAPGAPVKNRAVARLAGGAFTVTARDAATHVTVDVVGWWAPAEVTGGRLYQSRTATRVLDTTRGVGAPRAKVGPGGVIRVKVAGRGQPVPASARAVVMNLTARSATRKTFVTAWPNGTRRPSYPDLSVSAWRTTANLVVVRVGTQNRVKITNGRGYTHLVGDIVGYYP